MYSYYIYEPTVWETSFCAFKTFPFAFRFSNEILQLNDKWMHSFHFMKNLSVENTFLLFSVDTKMSQVLIKPFDVKQVCFFQNSLKLWNHIFSNNLKHFGQNLFWCFSWDQIKVFLRFGIQFERSFLVVSYFRFFDYFSLQTTIYVQQSEKKKYGRLVH